MARELTRSSVGQQVPRRGFWLSHVFGSICLKCLGWRLEGAFPDRPKMLIVVAPHTSNWDFSLGILAVLALGLDARWIAKHTLFESPLGGLFRRLGGIPVDRRAAHGVVDQIVATCDADDHFMLGITPEGTRSRVTRWKSGFYHIARRAQIPLVPACLDYRKKVIAILPEHTLTDSYDADLQSLQCLFVDVTPKHPDKFNLSIK